MDIADLLQSPSRLDDADQALLKRMLADPDIDPDEEDEQGDTPLGLACYLDQVEAVRLLLQSGRVDVNHAGAGGHTPLMQACWAGCWSAVDELLDRGADACARNAYGRTAFFYAVAGNQMEVLDRLFEHARSGTRIEYTLPAPSAELDGNVSFVVFPSEETKRLVSERLRELGVDVDSLDWLKETPPLDGDAEELRAACRQGDLQRLEELLDGEMRTDISAGDANGVTPLMEACAYGHAEVAIELLNAGAEPNAVDAWGRTALYYACAEGHARVVTKLGGARYCGELYLVDFELADCEGRSPREANVEWLYCATEAVVRAYDGVINRRAAEIRAGSSVLKIATGKLDRTQRIWMPARKRKRDDEDGWESFPEDGSGHDSDGCNDGDADSSPELKRKRKKNQGTAKRRGKRAASENKLTQTTDSDPQALVVDSGLAITPLPSLKAAKSARSGEHADGRDWMLPEMDRLRASELHLMSAVHTLEVELREARRNLAAEQAAAAKLRKDLERSASDLSVSKTESATERETAAKLREAVLKGEKELSAEQASSAKLRNQLRTSEAEKAELRAWFAEGRERTAALAALFDRPPPARTAEAD